MAARRDPEHTADLLWRRQRPGSRGPRGSLTVDQIVDTAVELADAEGMAGVTMGKVAKRLGVTTMSLYRYIPGKDDLVDLMFEQATGRPETTDWPTEWRARVRAFSHAQYQVLMARPWLLDVPIGTPPMGPNNVAWMEAGLSAMEPTPLTPEDRMGVLSVISGYALTEARQAEVVRRAAPSTGLTYTEWGAAYHQVLARVVEEGRYPALSAIVEAGVFADDRTTPEEEFFYGLDFILDGVEALMEKRRAAQGSAP
ncbi:TetR/AcrR family transcriptional regulator [Streptomyces xiamenensis]|uniref:TetR family transcriptional regulator n=1 Tax=Streptomyces xiamenensis TaxID=408015 RepID=A0A0F7FSG5_9ACTN|nr:TetR/AcrR family transcriptional regulator [Streptomyces xiamenensis]AKG43227.1 TetR family transcriptional regulator [Streptomyces xiamenensis]